ncbi:hypothetical protein Q4511_01955 [Paracoccus sp. 1_MG-2023]|uniref:hypothetical protein n=1 Tax=unclassified Paracoccus (in: a-proteobacteria) TaxID=2688777 RepID=UPI001C080F08|nr:MULTISPECIES: hypothetical protein [unclassified Paracoccus (in: a-proteobacteria)]MBU2958684.1 hypothetical protein [Paracoccus sp. C2R09]MDO6667677.1 hypothetical protein [Paracoccus sp. 1_MG-2023]
MRISTLATVAGIGVALAGCTQMTGSGTTTAKPETTPATAEQVSAATAITRAPAPRPAARATVAQLDTTTPEQRAAAAEVPTDAAEQKLGTTVGSLGNPTEGGLWMKTPLVKSRMPGRIVHPASGKSAKVELIPLTGGGSGSQVSLSALQLLGVSLTDLPTLEVYSGS